MPHFGVCPDDSKFLRSVATWVRVYDVLHLLGGVLPFVSLREFRDAAGSLPKRPFNRLRWACRAAHSQHHKLSFGSLL